MLGACARVPMPVVVTQVGCTAAGPGLSFHLADSSSSAPDVSASTSGHGMGLEVEVGPKLDKMASETTHFGLNPFWGYQHFWRNSSLDLFILRTKFWECLIQAIRLHARENTRSCNTLMQF